MNNVFTQYQTERGFTAREAAGSLGIPLSTWRKWTQGTRTPRPIASRLVKEALDNFRAVQAMMGNVDGVGS